MLISDRFLLFAFALVLAILWSAVWYVFAAIGLFFVFSQPGAIGRLRSSFTKHSPAKKNRKQWEREKFR